MTKREFEDTNEGSIDRENKLQRKEEDKFHDIETNDDTETKSIEIEEELQSENEKKDFAKTVSKKDITYSTIQVFSNGATEPFLVGSDYASNSYVLKEFLFNNQTSYRKLFEKLSSTQKDKEENAPFNTDIPENNRESAFYQLKDLFSIEFIRLVNKKIAPKAHIFEQKHQNQTQSAKKKLASYLADFSSVAEKNKEVCHAMLFTCGFPTPHLGTKFLEKYENWEDCYDPQNNHIKGKPIFVNDKEIKPIMGLGDCAVLSLVLLISDMHTENWGLQDKDNYYKATLIDAGLSFDRNPTCLDMINNATDILKLAFVMDKNIKNNQILSPLPLSLLWSSRIHKEVYSTIDTLKALLDSGQIYSLVQKYFKNNMADFIEPFFNMIQVNINFIHVRTLQAKTSFNLAMTQSQQTLINKIF